MCEKPTTDSGLIIGMVMCGIFGAFLCGPVGLIVFGILGMILGDEIEKEVQNYYKRKKGG